MERRRVISSHTSRVPATGPCQSGRAPVLPVCGRQQPSSNLLPVLELYRMCKEVAKIGSGLGHTSHERGLALGHVEDLISGERSEASSSAQMRDGPSTLKRGPRRCFSVALRLSHAT